jgi:hypothetical protein
MLVYRVKNDFIESDVVWHCWQDALDEIEIFLSENPDVEQTITLTVEQMTTDEYESLPEFEGY